MNPNGNEEFRRTLRSYTNPTTDFYGRSISIPHIRASSFELNPQLITLVQQNCQYSGLPQEEPTEFLADFLKVADTVHNEGVDQDVYRLLLFSFAVKDQVKRWLDNQSKASLKIWKQLVDKFLNQYFPPRKMTQLRLDIQDFKQGDSESLYDAWERYMRMLRKCPTKMFLEWVQLDIFYYGLSDMARMSLDHSAGGSIHMRKTIGEDQELIETIAINQHLYSTTETSIKGEVKAVTTEPNPLEQNDPLTQQLHALAQQLLNLQEALRKTQASNKNVKAQLSQTRQQITEEC
ncbi:hypothetical protein AHAS_Ahas13G0267100 [Arachis hypogaea]